jgi:hypothetical protein
MSTRDNPEEECKEKNRSNHQTSVVHADCKNGESRWETQNDSKEGYPNQRNDVDRNTIFSEREWAFLHSVSSEHQATEKWKTI